MCAETMPKDAVCHVCGKPIQIIDVSAMAASMGLSVPEGSVSIECCGFEQTLDDPEQAQQLLRALTTYHREQRAKDSAQKNAD